MSLSVTTSPACSSLTARQRKPVAVEQPDLGQVARVVADGDRLADEAGERRGDVAQALEADAVAPHATRLGMQDQQEVEVLEAVGKARQEALATPGVERGLADLAVDADVVGAGDEGADLAVEPRQRQCRGEAALPPTRCPGSSGSSSVLSVPNRRSTLPRPCGRPTAE